jgi:hypothetical protein
VIGDDGAKGVKEAPLGSLSDAGALTAIATIDTTGDITAGADLISTAALAVGTSAVIATDLTMTTGDVIMSAGATVDGIDVGTAVPANTAHKDTTDGTNPHAVEGDNIKSTAEGAGKYLESTAGGVASWVPTATPSAHALHDHQASTLPQLNSAIAGGTLIDTGDTRLSDDRPADEISTSGTNVTISQTAPTQALMVLKTTDATNAEWTLEAAADVVAESLGTTGAEVNVNLAAPPSTDQVLTATGATTAEWKAAPTAPTLSKTITMELPVSESMAFFYTPIAITLTQVRALIQGGTSIPVTVASGTTYLTVVDTNVSADADSLTTGTDLTITDATIAAGSNVWLTLGTPVGTQTLLTITLVYTED